MPQKNSDTLQISWYPPDPQFEAGVDIIGINTFHNTLKPDIDGEHHPAWERVVGWLQIHREADLSKEGPIHIAWLEEEHDFPIYMADNFERYPASQMLPIKDLCELWFYDDIPSFASSFDYAVAMGIHLGYEKIIMKNVHLLSTRESIMEAPGLMLWIGLAKMHGVSVDLKDSRLWEKYLYGFESRGIPLWATDDLARDLIVDYVNPESRDWYKMWRMYRTMAYDKMYGTPNALPIGYQQMTKEIAKTQMQKYYSESKEEVDDLDTP